jgi:hypothetical protein
MSSTLTRDRQEAVDIIEQGNADFTVFATAETEGGRFYFITVPYTTKQYGLFGRIGRSVGGTGHATKFGNDVFYSLLALTGVEPSLHDDNPYTLTLHVESATAEEPPNGMRHMSHGMPANICREIQAAIIRNDTFLTRRAEFLRRLF